MTHIEMYTKLLVVRKWTESMGVNENTQHEICRSIFESSAGLQTNPLQFAQSLGHKPTTRQQVKALAELGFSNQFIANLLDITPNNVAQHKTQPKQREYSNAYWKTLYKQSPDLPNYKLPQTTKEQITQ